MKTRNILEKNLTENNFELLKILLKDRTTNKYIKWATDNYNIYGTSYAPEEEMQPKNIIIRNTNLIQPRVLKTQEDQSKRTKDKAEVFTPSWICNEQNNLVDEAWFNRKNVFNTSIENGWITNSTFIDFPSQKTWKDYIDERRLEISCGEAPYLVSRYDTVSGKLIEVPDRIGLLDRKLRVINENVDDEETWIEWVNRAYQSIYGYEYQGDNLLIARENMFYTFIDNMEYKFNHIPTLSQMKKIATIISWNIWQMDGLTMTVPYSVVEQISWFALKTQKKEAIYCKIFDWRLNCSLEFRLLMNGG